MADTDYLDRIAAFLESLRERSADGLTVADLTQSTVDAMRVVIGLLDRVSLMTGEEKKTEVLKLVGYVFDQFADSCVPMLALPVWWIAKPAMRVLILSMASGAVEAILPVVRAA